jgi:hypothetical protein
MMRLAIPRFDTEMEKSGLIKVEIGQGIDFLGSPHPVGDAWLTEPYHIYAKAQNSKSGEDETVQISIRPAQGWKPVLSVSSTSLDPVMFETTCAAEKDISMIWGTIEKCFARLKAD